MQRLLCGRREVHISPVRIYSRFFRYHNANICVKIFVDALNSIKKITWKYVYTIPVQNKQLTNCFETRICTRGLTRPTLTRILQQSWQLLRIPDFPNEIFSPTKKTTARRKTPNCSGHAICPDLRFGVNIKTETWILPFKFQLVNLLWKNLKVTTRRLVSNFLRLWSSLMEVTFVKMFTNVSV